MIKDVRIAIIGLGYVGLPLAIEFAKKYTSVGFDLDKKRIDELNSSFDRTLEANFESLSVASNLMYSSDTDDIKNCNVYIVCVPISIDKHKNPDLSPLLSASKTVGKLLNKGDIVIYESTVYPGATEDDCVPVLEKFSSLKFNEDFFCGYSPERINPGDKINTLTKIVKITSGSTPEIAIIVNDLYKSIITAGTYMVSSIKVAEAAKLIENSQRDLNISFMNEIAIIFDLLDIDTNEVIDASATKWNFMKYKPGLVGGHCISVDPYYMIHKSISLNHYPSLLISAREVNEKMSSFIVNKLIRLMVEKELNVVKSKILILGISFKENCADTRNSKVVDIVQELQEISSTVDIYDPYVDKENIKNKFDINLIPEIVDTNYSAVLIAVAHDKFKDIDLGKYINDNSVIFDIKGLFDRSLVDARL
ncbi:MAG: nucleotide sugar dehydrogenase [Marinifilaceae bacterium]